MGFIIDVFVLDRAPETLDEDVVKGAPAPVPADANTRGFQRTSEGVRRELRALVGVEDLRLAALQGLMQGVETEAAV